MNRKKFFIIAAPAFLIFGLLAYLIFFGNIFGSKGLSIIGPENMGDKVEIANKESGSQAEANQPEDINQANLESQPSEKVGEETSAAGSDTKKEKADEKTNSSLSIINKYVSWGYAPVSGRKIDAIIIHSSYDAIGSEPYSVSGLISEYKEYGVAPHYLIDRSGSIYRLVAEKNIAYHAGESQVPDGRTNVNNFSLGIELMNKEDGKFTDSQYGSLKKLVADIKKRYTVKYVLGHNQIAPGRKTDPWNFDWGRL